MRRRGSSGSRRRPVQRDGPYWFDEDEAERYVQFVERLLVLWQGEHAGEPFVMVLWARKVVRDLFGWKRADGRRRYKTASIWVSKGNGKSPLAAAIGLAAMFLGGEGVEVYCCAGDKAQASIVATDARNLVEYPDSPLADRVEFLKQGLHTKGIYYPATRSKLEVLSAEAYTKHGFRPFVVVFDELHVQRDREFFDTMRLGLVKHDDSLLVTISTAGVYDPESLARVEYEYAKAVRDGAIENPSHYVVIFEAEATDDPLSPETWRKANPSLGVTLKEDNLREVFERAAQNPAEWPRVLQLHLGIWPSPVIENGIDMAAWERAGAKDQLITRGDSCWIGLDLSSKLDLTSLVALFEHGDGSWSALPYYWMPTLDLSERSRRDVFDYQRAVKSGQIVMTPGTWVAQEPIRDVLCSLRDTYAVQAVAYDPHNASDIATWMEAEGFRVEKVQQSARNLSEACKFLVGLVAAENLRHAGHPVLTWNARNTAFRRTDWDEWRPAKDKTSRRRIDGISAIVHALTVARKAEPTITAPSFWSVSA